MQESKVNEMYIDGIKDIQKTVCAREDKGLLTASVKIDVYAAENAKWVPGEKEDFLRRVEEICYEVRDWLKEQISTDENARGE